MRSCQSFSLQSLQSLCLPLVAASTPQSSGNVSWLHTSGTQIYDESDHLTHLYGVNLASGQGQGVTLADIQTVKALGFNTFRLNDVDWDHVQPFDETSQGIDERFFTTRGYNHYGRGLDEIISWGVNENMYMIICLGWGGLRVPKWAFPQIPSSSYMDDTQRYAALINGTAAKRELE